MRFGGGVHREDLVLHAKRRLSPRLHLVRLGEGETQLAESVEWETRRAFCGHNVGMRAGRILTAAPVPWWLEGEPDRLLFDGIRKGHGRPESVEIPAVEVPMELRSYARCATLVGGMLALVACGNR